MKKLLLLALTSFAGFTTAAVAYDGHCNKTCSEKKACTKGDKKSCAKTETCTKGDKKAGTCTKGEKTSCAKSECTKSSCASVHFTVTGMKGKQCKEAVKSALAGVEGAKVKKVCHQSGCAVINYDAKKTNKTALQKAITVKGFKVAGENINIPVKGMKCTSCSGKLTKTLNALDGVKVKKVCHKSGHCSLLVDSNKTTKEKVEKAIKAKGFKVEAKKKAATPTKKAPAKKAA